MGYELAVRPYPDKVIRQVPYVVSLPSGSTALRTRSVSRLPKKNLNRGMPLAALADLFIPATRAYVAIEAAQAWPEVGLWQEIPLT